MPIRRLLVLFAAIIIGTLFVFTGTTHAQGEVYAIGDDGIIVGAGGTYAAEVQYRLTTSDGNIRYYSATTNFETMIECSGERASVQRQTQLEGQGDTPRIEYNTTTRSYRFFPPSGATCGRGSDAWSSKFTTGAITVSTDTTIIAQNTNRTPTDEEVAGTEETAAQTCENTAEPAALRFMMCPIIDTAVNSVGLIDTYIESLLDFDVQTFEESPARNAWQSFRILAYSLILIAGLVIVIGQAAGGVQFLDAYTIKKALPRLLIAVVFIAISWELLLFATTFINDLGRWIQDILLEPFSGANSITLTKLLQGSAALGGTAVVGGAIGVVYLATLGFMGTATLLLTGVLALLIGLAVLSVRTMVITLALIVAPLAIACMILPATQKVWDLWRKTLTTALLIFPLIMMLLAAGKIAAGLTTNGVMAVLFYLAPYFLIPFTFRLAGGIVGRIAGLTDDKTRGLLDRGKKFREEQYGYNKQQAVEGRSRLGASAIGGFHRRAQFARQGGFIPGSASQARYQGAVTGMMAEQTAKTMDSAAGRAASGNDDANKLLWQNGVTRDSFIRGYVNQGHTEEQAIQAAGVFEAGSGARIGTRGARAFAGAALLGSNTGIDEGSATQNAAYEAQVAGSLIRDGIFTSSETTSFTMNAKGRADRVSGGFGQTMTFHDLGATQAGPSGADIQKHVDKNIAGANAGAILFGNSRAVKYAAPEMAKLVGVAAASGNSAEFVKQLAWGANQHDSLSRSSPDLADTFAENYMSQAVTYNGEQKTIREWIDLNRDQPTFQDRRKEWATATAANAAQAQQATPGAPAAGPLPGGPGGP